MTDWHSKLFLYCERGSDPGFWAEPFNAVSNAAFMLAAVIAWGRARRAGSGVFEHALIVLVALIGIGSFLFHTLAERWAMLADTAPIGLFMLAYLAFALRRFAQAKPSRAALALAAFVGIEVAAGTVRCNGGPCLAGSLGYAPALLALVAVGGWLAHTGHPAAQFLLVAAAVFVVSLGLRTLDGRLCPATAIWAGKRLGSHVFWHLANAGVLFILLEAAVGRSRGRAGGRDGRI